MLRFLFLCLLTLSTAAPITAETYRNPRRIPTSDNPVGVRLADINGDGLSDIVYGDAFVSPNAIHILLAQPGGGYTAASPLALPSQTVAVCQPIDANGDHKLDLVCPYYPPTGPSGGYLETFFGNGDGTFQSPVVSLVSAVINVFDSVFIYPPADLNSDGHVDLIVSTAGSPAIMLGDGAGHFTFASNSSGGNGPLGNIATTDINGDGKPDLVSSNPLIVAFGNGNGTFGSPTYYGTYNNCAFHDMDRDGHIDAICAGNPPGISGTQLSILHGNSNGTFTSVATQPYAGTAIFRNPIAVADLNNDGILDILAYSDDGLAVILGKTNLQFADPVHYPVGYLIPETRLSTLITDMNYDGSPDVVASGPDGVFITYGRPDGTLDTGSVVESGNIVTYATVADFIGDHIPDVATTGDASLRLRLGNGDGTFGPISSLPMGGASFSSVNNETDPILHGDFNGDGKQDILPFGGVSGSNDARAAYLLFGHGDATFDPPVLIPGSSYSRLGTPSMLYKLSQSETVGDLNKDGRDDIIAGDSGVIDAFLSNGDGSFTLVQSSVPTDVPSGYNPPSTPAALADFNHDGKLDIIVGSINHAYILLGRGDGSFAPSSAALSIPQSVGIITSSIATGDFDGDGNPDIALVNYRTVGSDLATGSVAVYVYYGNGDGTFSPPLTAGVYNEGYTSLATADLNHDGLDDLVLSSKLIGPNFDGVGVVHARFGRTFDQLATYTAGGHIASRDISDLNRDGFPDLLFANGDFQIPANAYTVLLNVPNPTVFGTLIANPEPSFVNQPFVLTATLSAPDGSNTPLSGTITFAIDGTTVGTATLASNIASITVTPSPRTGAHQLTATWLGDNTYSGIALRATHTVTGYPVALPFTSSANPVFLGQPFSLQYSVSNAASVPVAIPQPFGTFSLTDNGSNIFTPLIVNGGLSGSTSFGNGLAPIGQHILVASYSGDALHEPASVTIIENLTAVSSTTILQTSPNPSVYGKPITVSATVTIPTGDSLGRLLPPPQPTVTFTGFPGGAITTLAALNPTLSTATATVLTASYTAISVPAGTYTITASYSGNVNTQPSTSSPITHIVQAATTTTTLTANPASAFPNQPITLSANVTGVLATPTGFIRFFDGTTPLSTVTLASGAAALTSQLSIGVHSLTAVYSGDSNNLTSTSSAVKITIFPSDFNISFDPSSISLVTGHHTTLHLTATSTGIFADTVRLSASNLPQWVTVQFKPVDLKLTAGGTATTSVYVDTDAVIGYMSKANPRPTRTPGIPAAAAALALILAPITLRRRRRITTLLALTLAASLLAGTSGCSGKYPDSTLLGVYSLKITATGAQTGLTHTINLPLTVTQ